MKFLPVLDLRLRHAFYMDERCPDFVIEPSPRTEALLRNHRCVLKPRPDGAELVMMVTADGKPFIPVSEGEKLTFHLRLKNNDFPLFSDLSGFEGLTAPMYTNADLVGGDGFQLMLGSRESLFSETLEVTDPASAERFVLSGTPVEHLAASAFQVLSSGKVREITTYDEGSRTITVNTDSAVQGEYFDVEYPVPTRLPRGVFADVEIVANNTVPRLFQASDRAAEPKISFQTKRAKWAYYFFTDQDPAAVDFRIVDTSGSDSVLRFSVHNLADQTDLKNDPDPANKLADELKKRYHGLSMLRFVSEEPIACQQGGRKQLALQLNGETIFEPLPISSPRHYSMLQNEQVLIEVIKFVSPSFSTAGV